VILPPRARRIYDKFERKSIITIDGSTIRAGLTITQMAKLQQMAGGFVIDDEGEILSISSAKIRAVVDIARARRGSFVVFCRYVEEMHRLSSALQLRGYVTELLYGKVRDNRRGKFRTELLQRFQNDETDVLIAQIRTGGVGVDLWKAQYAIVYSTTYSYIDLDQAMMRLCHIDRKDAPEVFCLRAVDTIDDEIWPAQHEKRDITKAIMRRLRKKKRD